MNCRLAQRYLDAYVDHELDPGTQLDVERHVDVCAQCQEEIAFARAMKEHVRGAVGSAQAPVGLADRIRSSLDEVESETRPAPLVSIAPMRLRHAIPLAAAAAVLMVGSFALSPSSPQPKAAQSRRPVAAPMRAATSAATIPIFEDVVRVHASDLPADVGGTQPQEVTRWFRNKVSFPVRPARFERRDARLLGARLSNVREQQAAALYYDVGGNRVTVVVFGPADRHLDQGLSRARLLGREVRYRQVRGYTVPVREQEGLTYAFTGDLDRQSLLRLAATAQVQH
jgi:anti-sigma factor RsiW